MIRLYGRLTAGILVDKDGYMHVPQKPGLGFEPDEEALKEYEIKDYYVGE